jgi:hypothetical protein
MSFWGALKIQTIEERPLFLIMYSFLLFKDCFAMGIVHIFNENF